MRVGTSQCVTKAVPGRRRYCLAIQGDVYFGQNDSENNGLGAMREIGRPGTGLHWDGQKGAIPFRLGRHYSFGLPELIPG